MSYQATFAVITAALISGAIIALLGIAILVAGSYLAALGGSWYYVAAGVGFLLTGVLLFARRPAALWVYADTPFMKSLGM